ncbi:MAG: aminoacyl-tRNA hydrolase [Bacteroidales bacterium]|jgi:PTH1 family peptidyl-tRNA hydrolase|nr:aminoacyl-tRNA hydrolase [Bacteroidales bacterium]
MKFLIACLGNIGAEYEDTRHNIGFWVADRLADQHKVSFTTGRLAQSTLIKHRGRSLVVIKPTTFMNLSGKAIQYWMQHEQIPVDRLLVVVDDIALPLGMLRMKKKGGDAGHNGLNHIIQSLGTSEFARLRFGIGDDFPKGRQVDFVLGRWKPSEIDVVEPRLDVAAEMVLSFTTIGIERTMTKYNNK